MDLTCQLCIKHFGDDSIMIWSVNTLHVLGPGVHLNILLTND